MLSKEQVKNLQKTFNEDNSKVPIVFSALSDPGRLKIFKLLMKNSDICVTDIARIFDISVPAASQQLRILEMAGLVKSMRMQQMVCYEINNDDPLTKSLVKILAG